MNALVQVPICDVCNKPVDRIDWWDDYNRCVRVFRVSCHGETETAELSDYMVEDSLSITMGRAFVKEKVRGIEGTAQQQAQHQLESKADGSHEVAT